MTINRFIDLFLKLMFDGDGHYFTSHSAMSSHGLVRCLCINFDTVYSNEFPEFDGNAIR